MFTTWLDLESSKQASPHVENEDFRSGISSAKSNKVQTQRAMCETKLTTYHPAL